MTYQDIIAAQERLALLVDEPALAAAKNALAYEALLHPIPMGMGQPDADTLVLQAIATRRNWQIDVAHGTAAEAPGCLSFQGGFSVSASHAQRHEGVFNV